MQITRNKIKRNKKDHCSSALHVWCQGQFERQKNIEAEESDANDRADEKVIRNALFCLKRGLSAADFLGSNEKDLGSDIRNTATKIDSSSSFFRIRNVTFDLYNERQKIFFKNEVKYICVTLDKVTVKNILHCHPDLFLY